MFRRFTPTPRKLRPLGRGETGNPTLSSEKSLEATPVKVWGFISTTLFLALVAVAISFAAPVYAAESGCDIKFIPSITIPGSNFIAGKEMSLNCSSLGEYVKSIYTFSVYAGSILAVVVLMIGGFIWLTAGGNVSQVGQARSYIGGAIAGFVLLLLSWTLLQTVNPKLVEFRSLSINKVEPLSIEARNCFLYKTSEDRIEQPDLGVILEKSPLTSCDIVNVTGDQTSDGEKCFCRKPIPGVSQCCFAVSLTTCPTLVNGCIVGDFSPISPTEACKPNTGYVDRSFLTLPNETCEDAYFRGAIENSLYRCSPSCPYYRSPNGGS